jgi:acyl-CoA synthetase (NDP forming)/RimJ/RimL family protein N-acetyltransferase
MRPEEVSYALLTDGSTVEIRPARPQDADAVREMHEQMSPDNMYLRFFGLSQRAAGQEAHRVCRESGPEHAALLAWLGGQLVGVASYEPTGKPGEAEIAFAVGDNMHGHGIATLLLEHLVSTGRRRRLQAFTAQTLVGNSAMLGVFSSAGLTAQRRTSDGVVESTFPLTGEDRHLDRYLAAAASRESRADVVSLAHLLNPASLAVVGVSRRGGTAGREVLRNIVAGGFAGHVYPVHPSASSLEGIPCVASVAGLPEPVDLAVIAVPAAAVPDVAAQCGRRGVRSLVVITAGLGAGGAELLAVCRTYGMRLVGPDCLGIAVPGIGLHANLAAARPLPGSAGVVVQSGGVGIFLLEHLSRLGIGVSSFASVGDKLDVSSNDLLEWWEQDAATTLAVLYVESFGSPRKFARTARRVGLRLPVLTVLGGRSAARQRAGASRTALAVTAQVTQETLFGQAGVIVARSLGELVEAAALLASQPLPAGHRIAVVSNAGGAGALAADACSDSGLQVATLSGRTQRSLAGLLPAGSAVAGPVDATAAVGLPEFRSCLRQVAADDGVDAVLAVIAATAMSDLSAVLATAELAKPMAAVVLGQPEVVRMLRDGEPEQAPGSEPAAVPVYADPAGAARALGHAARYRAWRTAQRGLVPVLSGLRAGEARTLISAFLAGSPAGGWLPAATAADLISCYQIPLVPPGGAAGQDQGVAATASRDDGVEVVIGVVQEPVFGPLVMFGLGGRAGEALGDRVARLTPLTDVDAAELIQAAPGASLLLGRHGAAGADTAALADALLRVSRLADDLPEVSELDLSPVIARPGGSCAVSVRVRVSPAEPPDPFLRQLR